LFDVPAVEGRRLLRRGAVGASGRAAMRGPVKMRGPVNCPPAAATATAVDWRTRERALADAADILPAPSTPPGPTDPGIRCETVLGPPYRTIDPAVPAAVLACVTDPHITCLPPGIGSVGAMDRQR